MCMHVCVCVCVCVCVRVCALKAINYVHSHDIEPVNDLRVPHLQRLDADRYFLVYKKMGNAFNPFAVSVMRDHDIL